MLVMILLLMTGLCSQLHFFELGFLHSGFKEAQQASAQVPPVMSWHFYLLVCIGIFAV